MAIKAIRSISNQESVTVYPAIMHYKEPDEDIGVILLMTDKTTGTVIQSVNPSEIGVMHDDWDEDYCTIYNGSITLSNQ